MTLPGIRPALLEFAEPWLAREPQLLLAGHFATAGQARERFVATQVLLRELFESVLAVSDLRVAQARLGWWLDEAAHWASGTSRHPLAKAFSETEMATDLAVLVQQLLRWLEAPSASAMSELAQRFIQFGEQLARISGVPADIDHWGSASFCVALRMSLQAKAPLASLMPLDALARAAKTRANWAQSEPGVLTRLLGEVGTTFPWPSRHARTPEMRAMLAVERRWLHLIARGGDPLPVKVGVFDVFASWRAARY